jgi:hypothetical protein
MSDFFLGEPKEGLLNPIHRAQAATLSAAHTSSAVSWWVNCQLEFHNRETANCQLATPTIPKPPSHSRPSRLRQSAVLRCSAHGRVAILAISSPLRPVSLPIHSHRTRCPSIDAVGPRFYLARTDGLQRFLLVTRLLLP